MSNLDSEELPDTRPDDQLAFSKIKEEIELRANEKAETIIKEAKLTADEILSAARNEASKEKQDIVTKAVSEATNIKIREVSRKKLSLKMDYLKTREEILEEIQLEARSKIQAYTKSKKYSEFLSNLLAVSSLSIGGGDLVLHLRSEDKSLFTTASLAEVSKKVSEESGVKTSIKLAKDDLKSLGGLKLERADSKLFIDNSFETRIERLQDGIREALQELLNRG